MVQVNCEMSAYSTGKKGGRLSFALNSENARKIETVLANFRDKPILLTVEIDAAERRAQLGRITDEQRKKVYALLGYIGQHFGEEVEAVKAHTKQTFCIKQETEPFSLSDCSRELARQYIDFLVEFCLENGVPMPEHPTTYISELGYYQIACIKNKVCCVCGKPGEVHHYDALGMGADRKTYDDSGNRKMCLCRVHHREIHSTRETKEEFCARYHVEPVVYAEG